MIVDSLSVDYLIINLSVLSLVNLLFVAYRELKVRRYEVGVVRGKKI